MTISWLISRSQNLIAALSARRVKLLLRRYNSPKRAPLTDRDVVLQSHTHEWLRSMPRSVHPKQLCRHYPRVANNIALWWSDSQLTDRLLLDLMVDRRGLRRGFAPRIAGEIDRLYRYHATRMTRLLRPRPGLHAPGQTARNSVDPRRRVDLGLGLSVRPIER